MKQNLSWRRAVDLTMKGLCLVAAFLSILPLFLILFHIVRAGMTSLNVDFFIHLPVPVGETGGGFANAIVGTIVMMGLSLCVSLPIGLLGGIYLAEQGANKMGHLVQFSSDILNGIPSIVIGIFVYTIVVLPMRHFSALAGGVALGIITIPIILRTTETMVKMVAPALREGGLALGLPAWKTFFYIVLQTARPGILTGVLLGVARAAGETAPLLFTALGNQFWATSLNQPIAALPLQIFTYAISPFDEWHRQAWAGGLVLIGMVLLLNVGSRVLLRSSIPRRR